MELVREYQRTELNSAEVEAQKHNAQIRERYNRLLSAEADQLASETYAQAPVQEVRASVLAPEAPTYVSPVTAETPVLEQVPQVTEFVREEVAASVFTTEKFDRLQEFNGVSNSAAAEVVAPTYVAPVFQNAAAATMEVEQYALSSFAKKVIAGVGILSTSDFRVAPGADFNTTISIQGTDIKNTIINITFDNEIACLESIALPEHVRLIEQGDDYITIEILSAEDNVKVPVANIKFAANANITTGNYTFLSLSSEDLIESDFQKVKIYDVGDLNGDGKVNTRDLAMLRQYVVGMIMLDDAQLVYANIYKDFDANNNPKVNTRDIGILQQYIVGLVEKIG